MRHYRFYHLQNGAFHGRMFSTDDAGAVAGNTPAGHKAIEGEFDPLSQRMNLATGQVEDYQPAVPSADHEWDEVSRRWVLKQAAAASAAMRLDARQRIHTLEQGAQPRAVREALLGRGTEKLQAIDAQIGDLRKTLSA